MSDEEGFYYGFSGLMIGQVIAGGIDDNDNNKNGWPLSESELDRMASAQGWTKLSTESSTAPMSSYRKDSSRLNFWLSTGTVGSYLDHPTQGKTQLFRREITMDEAPQLFANPRQHTGRGYQQRGGRGRGRGRGRGGGRGACRYGSNCHRPNCPFDHQVGAGRGRGGGGGGRGPCRYGDGCNRSDCWFSHPDGR